MRKKLYLVVPVTIAAVIYMLSGVLWLGIMLIFGFLACMIFKTKKIKESKGIYAILRRATLIILFFFIAISIRLLFFEVYSIPSSSMERALIPGDVVWMNKLTYGPKLPTSPFEIPWINILFYFNSNARTKMDIAWWADKRLAGFSKVSQGDIVVFTRFKNQQVPFIKRCASVPGDFLKVKDGTILNFESNSTPANVLIPTEIIPRKPHEFKELMDSLGVDVHRNALNENVGKRFVYNARIPEKVFKDLSHLMHPDSLYVPAPPAAIESWYLKGVDPSWNIYNFGPIAIPKKGYNVKLNKKTHALYSLTIQEFEGKTIIYRDGKFLLDQKEITSYTFENDYYFIMGDNRGDSQDSRYYGFVPQQNIIGKADILLFSSGDNGFRWDRMLRKL